MILNRLKPERENITRSKHRCYFLHTFFKLSSKTWSCSFCWKCFCIRFFSFFFEAHSTFKIPLPGWDHWSRADGVADRSPDSPSAFLSACLSRRVNKWILRWMCQMVKISHFSIIRRKTRQEEDWWGGEKRNERWARGCRKKERVVDKMRREGRKWLQMRDVRRYIKREHTRGEESTAEEERKQEVDMLKRNKEERIATQRGRRDKMKWGEEWGIWSKVEEGGELRCGGSGEQGGQRQMKGSERGFTCCWCIMLARITLDTRWFNLPSNKHTQNLPLQYSLLSYYQGVSLKYLNPEQRACHVQLVSCYTHTHTHCRQQMKAIKFFPMKP